MDDNITTYLQEADQLIKTGQPQEALVFLIWLLQEDLDNAEAWYLLGLAVAHPEKKLFAFRQALRIDPCNARAQEQVVRMSRIAPVSSQQT